MSKTGGDKDSSKEDNGWNLKYINLLGVIPCGGVRLIFILPPLLLHPVEDNFRLKAQKVTQRDILLLTFCVKVELSL